MRKLAACLVGSMVLVFLVSPALGQGNGTTERTQFSLDGTVVSHPCTGEAVTLKGAAQILTHTTTTATGQEVSVLQINAAGITATSATGTRYRLADVLHLVNVAPAPALVRTDVSTLTFVSAGGAENSLARTTFHVTVSASGGQTVVRNVVADCVG